MDKIASDRVSKQRSVRRWAFARLASIAVATISCACSTHHEVAAKPVSSAVGRLPGGVVTPEVKAIERCATAVSANKFQLPPGVLTLVTARETALLANPDVDAASARLRTASARLEEATARYVPTVEFTQGSFRAFQIPGSLDGVAGLISPGSTSGLGGLLGVSSLFNAFSSGSVDPFSEHVTSFSASWVVFDGFVREAAVQAGRHIELAATYSYRDVQRLLVRAVDAAYFQVQLAAERLRIAQSAEVFSRDQLSVTEKLREADRASIADVQNFRVRMLAAQTEVITAIGMQEAGRVVLAELLGLPEASLPETISLEPLAEETAAELAAPDVQAAMVEALASRPDIHQLEHLVGVEEASIRAAKGEYLPTVAVGGSWGFDRTSNLKYSEDDQSSAAGIAFRWALLSASRRAKVRQAEGRHAEMMANVSRRRLAIASEVRRAVIQVTDVQQQIILQREAVAAATENRRVVQAAYLAGKESLTRLNETQRDFVSAEANLAVARIRLRQAWSELEAAIGPASIEASVKSATNPEGPSGPEPPRSP